MKRSLISFRWHGLYLSLSAIVLPFIMSEVIGSQQFSGEFSDTGCLRKISGHSFIFSCHYRIILKH
jgi:hypothetical protein